MTLELKDPSKFRYCVDMPVTLWGCKTALKYTIRQVYVVIPPIALTHSPRVFCSSLRSFSVHCLLLYIRHYLQVSVNKYVGLSLKRSSRDFYVAVCVSLRLVQISKSWRQAANHRSEIFRRAELRVPQQASRVLLIHEHAYISNVLKYTCKLKENNYI